MIALTDNNNYGENNKNYPVKLKKNKKIEFILQFLLTEGKK